MVDYLSLILLKTLWLSARLLCIYRASCKNTTGPGIEGHNNEDATRGFIPISVEQYNFERKKRDESFIVD